MNSSSGGSAKRELPSLPSGKGQDHPESRDTVLVQRGDGRSFPAQKHAPEWAMRQFGDPCYIPARQIGIETNLTAPPHPKGCVCLRDSRFAWVEQSVEKGL